MYHTWTSVSYFPFGDVGSYTVELNCTFDSLIDKKTRSCAVIEYDGILSGEMSAGSSMMGMQMKMRNGSITGSSCVDPELGFSIGGVDRFNFTADMTLPTPQGSETASMIMEQERRTRLTSIKTID